MLAGVLSLFALLLLGLSAPARADGPVLFVEDPALVARLEQSGYGFGKLFGVDGPDDLESLITSAPAYRVIADTISADVGEIRDEIAAGGRPLYEFTAVEAGRVMDMRWLSTPAARMKLVGVVNRLDRRDFQEARGDAQKSCGEMRLIYRLAYAFRKDGKGKVLASRMPFSFNAVFDVKPDADGGCTGVASRWTPGLDEALDAGWLAGGPLARDAITFRQLELNAQVVRFPSGQEPQFGGQAVYLMRIFGIDGERVTELPLENTPDLARLEDDAALKAKLAAYVADNAGVIDSGVYQVPDEFLARRVISYSTFGNARVINHPFATLYNENEFAAVDMSAGKLVRSPRALIERLDNGTCQGCHQSGSTAGFHFIGLDDDTTSPLNRIEVGISPHFHAELPRRKAWVEAVADERAPNPFRPLSFAPPAEWNADGYDYEPAEATMGCIAPEDAALFGETWGCGGGTVCTPLAGREPGRIALAQCLVKPDSKDMFSGHPCLAGEVAASSSAPFNDTYKLTQFAAFAEKASPSSYTCRPPRIGVPGGLAYRQCNEKDRAFANFKPGVEMPREICGLTGGKKFDLCVATGNFDSCLSGAIQRGNRTACSADHLCRDDYMCQAFPPDTPNVRKVKGIGFCSPTYFVFQMRIDNHTTPWEREVPRGLEDDQSYRSVEVDEDPDGLW